MWYMFGHEGLAAFVSHTMSTYGLYTGLVGHESLPDSLDVCASMFALRARSSLVSQAVQSLMSDQMQADPNVKDSRGANVLHVAAEHGRSKIVQWLVGDGGMDVGCMDARGHTAMHYACMNERSPVIEALSKLSVRLVNQKSHAGVTPLMFLCENTSNTKLVARFIRYGGAVDVQDREGNTALFYAARKDRHEVCGELLMSGRVDRGALLEHENAAGQNAMAVAEACGATRALNVLANGGLFEDGKKRERVTATLANVGGEESAKKEQAKKAKKARKESTSKSISKKRKIPEGVSADLIAAWEKIGAEKRPPRCYLCKTCLNRDTMKQACLTMRDYFGDSTRKSRTKKEDHKGAGSGAKRSKGRADTKDRGGHGHRDKHGQREPPNYSDIFEAAQAGDIEAVRQFVDDGVDVNTGNSEDDETTALLYAALNGYANMVDELILTLGADENVTDQYGTTVLMCAAQEGYYRLIRSLCSDPDTVIEDSDDSVGRRKTRGQVQTHGHEVDPNIKNDDGDTALHYAAERGHLKAVQELLKFGADPTLKNTKGRTAQDEAESQGKSKVAKVLAAAARKLKEIKRLEELKSSTRRLASLVDDSDASDHDDDNEEESDVDMRKEYTTQIQEIKRIFKNEMMRKEPTSPSAKPKAKVVTRKDPRVPTPTNSEALDRETRIEAMELSAEAKELLAEIKLGHIERVRRMVKEAGVSVETCTVEGTTGLMMVCMDGVMPMVKLLIDELNADPKASDETGMTVLMHATQEGHVAIAKALIERHGVDVNAASKDGDTALMYASQGGHLETAKLLVANGADVDALDSSSHSALMLACEEGHLDVASFLLDKGSRVDPEWLVKLAKGTGAR